MGGVLRGFGPGGIDCDEVLADVFLYLDEEGDGEVVNRIRRHLEQCAPCLKQYGIEQDVKSLIARCCGGDIAPESLRDRIRLRITEVSMETSYREFRAE